MEFRRRKIDEVQLTLINEGKYDEVTIFKGLLNKLQKDCKSVGFQTKFNKQEKELINFLTIELNEESKD